MNTEQTLAICQVITANESTNGNAIAFLTLIVAIIAIRIPRSIMVNQRFMCLTEQYRSPEMGFAIHCIPYQGDTM